MTPPRRGGDELARIINELRDDVAALKAQLRKPAGGAGALAPGFNAFGMLIGKVEGHAPPINSASPPSEAPPITWTKVKSDDPDLKFDAARLQMPSDGLFMIFLTFGEVWARRTNRAGNLGTFFSISDGGNMAGVILFASAQYGGVTGVAEPGTEILGGTFLGYGNAVALGLSANYMTEGRPPGVILPTRINVIAEVHRLIEG